jgi:hypothetical protein
MTIQVINNGETGLQVRTKLNANFDELYSQIEMTAALSADTVIDDTYGTVLVDATAANTTITLPTAGSIAGKIYRIQKADATAHTVIIACNGAETINGATTVTIKYQYSCASVQSDGTNWIKI